MDWIKSKWYILSLVLGVSAFLAAFGVAYAGFVQWSREQPSKATSQAATVLAPESMKLFQDAGLTDELTADEVLEFPAVVRLQPPLQRSTSAWVELWLRNDSDIPMNLLSISVRDPQQGLDGWTWSVECCNPIQPGQARQIGIGIYLRQDVVEVEFSTVIGAVGEVTEEGQAVTTISPQLQAILDAAKQQKSGE